jgi:predicted Zn finger-like uncharacterized protein
MTRVGSRSRGCGAHRLDPPDASTVPVEKYTRCPGCHTVFRVTPEQLAIREGQVRCGHCKTVFDGVAQQISLAPRPQPAEPDDTDDDAALGPATVTLRSAQALHPAAAAPPPSPEAASADEDEVEEIAYEERFAWAKPRKAKRSNAFYAGAIPLLIVALATQLLFHYRDAIAAHWPEAKPVLARVCQFAGCAIHPLRDLAMRYLSIDASDLQADPAHKGLLVLSASIRSHAAWPLAYPDLEFTLTDADNSTVVRRVLTPRDYAAGTADLANGIAPNAEVPIKLFIDASATTQAGYLLYLFYP